MTALTLNPTIARLTDRVHDVVEAVYEAPAPQAGPGVTGKLRFVGYVVGSALVWGLAAIAATALLGALLSIG